MTLRGIVIVKLDAAARTNQVVRWRSGQLIVCADWTGKHLSSHKCIETHKALRLIRPEGFVYNGVRDTGRRLQNYEEIITSAVADQTLSREEMRRARELNPNG
jgi:hypothetical protein